MNPNIQVFNFSLTNRALRVITNNGEPWFILTDVCKALGIENVGNAAARLDADEKSSIRLMDGTSKGGNPNVTIISESGFYVIVMRSDKPVARAFQRWVTKEVLPTIRKTGQYGRASSTISSTEPLPCNPVAPEVVHLKAFAREHCVRTPGEATYASLIWKRYKQWCARQGCMPQPYSFVEAMFISWGCTKVVSYNRVAYMNVGLR